MDSSRLVFIDEAGFIVGMNRLYGWSRVGEQAIILRETRGKRLSLVGAMSADGSRGMMSFEGTLKTAVMLRYIENYLGPNLRSGDVVVMDGCPVHKAKAVRKAIEHWGATLLILPAYSPELNPIEHLWSTLKARVRAVGTSSWRELNELVHQVWNSFEPSFYPNWVNHCGYMTTRKST